MTATPSAPPGPASPPVQRHRSQFQPPLDCALDVVPLRTFRDVLSRAIAPAALAVGTTLGAAVAADAATFLVQWEGSDFGYVGEADGAPEVVPPSPFDAISGSFQITLEPGIVVEATSDGLVDFDASFPIGSEAAYYFDGGGLFVGGAEDGIGEFGDDDLFLFVFDVFGDPVIAGLGFSSDGDIFGAKETWLDVTEIAAPGPSPVPLPASAMLLLGGIGGLLTLRRRR